MGRNKIYKGFFDGEQFYDINDLTDDQLKQFKNNYDYKLCRYTTKYLDLYNILDIEDILTNIEENVSLQMNEDQYWVNEDLTDEQLDKIYDLIDKFENNLSKILKIKYLKEVNDEK